MSGFALDYFFFVFVAAIGILVIVTAASRLDGLLLAPRRISIILGIVISISACVWFFASKPRNVPDAAAGLNGNEQAILFVLGAIAALVTLLIISSLRNYRMNIEPDQHGLEALRKTSYINLMWMEIKRTWLSWKK